MTWKFAIHLSAHCVCFGKYLAQVVAVRRGQKGGIWIGDFSRNRYDIRTISVNGNVWRRDSNLYGYMLNFNPAYNGNQTNKIKSMLLTLFSFAGIIVFAGQVKSLSGWMCIRRLRRRLNEVWNRLVENSSSLQRQYKFAHILRLWVNHSLIWGGVLAATPRSRLTWLRKKLLVRFCTRMSFHYAHAKFPRELREMAVFYRRKS